MADSIDMLFSIVLGGMLMINVLTVNDIAAETYSVYAGDMSVQEILVTTVQVLEGEFRNMGFGVPENERTVLAADSSSITFLIDLDRDGAGLDTVRYFAGRFHGAELHRQPAGPLRLSDRERRRTV